ncbi:NUDIX hydrolase [Acetobacter conturbans]|uniref:NUDIX domain-containing protein n=1 Tax=Acetobacter conturbans TaxID=1737472 RepID=A0ABX0JYT8_9PROT|nr:NUDIX domain-containing protein [Acetobacter conturbans]NHN87628.1 NUDIX domain-containing protein [Acetobacter conturbans]
MTSNQPIEPRGAVLAVCRHPVDGTWLLVRRANPPDAGLWGFPGGRIDPGEDLFIAASRELMEETGVTARGEGVITAFDSIHRDENGALLFHYVIVAVKCVVVGPVTMPVAGDDALEAEWLDLPAIEALGVRASAGVAALARLAAPGA